MRGVHQLSRQQRKCPSLGPTPLTLAQLSALHCSHLPAEVRPQPEEQASHSSDVGLAHTAHQVSCKEGSGQTRPDDDGKTATPLL